MTTTFDIDNLCVDCRAHIADPCSPDCPSGGDAAVCKHDAGWTDCGRTCQHMHCVLCGQEQEED